MSLGSALSIAVAGMQLNQTETGIVAQNIARAGQAGYTAKRVEIGRASCRERVS
jgi:flagellar hook-associated protein FlgK